MKKLTTLMIAISLMATMSISLSGCGTEASTSPTETTQTTATVDTIASTSVSETTEASTSPTEEETQNTTATEETKSKSSKSSDSKTSNSSSSEKSDNSSSSSKSNSSSSSSSSKSNSSSGSSSSKSNSSSGSSSSKSNSSSSSSSSKSNSSSGSSSSKSNSSSSSSSKSVEQLHKEYISKESLDYRMNYVNNYFQNKGCTINYSLTIDQTGWLNTDTDGNFVGEYETKEDDARETAESFDETLCSLFKLDGETLGKTILYSDLEVRCYYAQKSNGEYVFYFCYW